MIRSLEIRGLRGIARGHLDDLGALTVLVGPNNSGKSTCLEALGVGVGAGVMAPDGSLSTVTSMLLRRGGSPHHALKVVANSTPREGPFRFEVDLATSSGTISTSMECGYTLDPKLHEDAINEGFSSPFVQVEIRASFLDQQAHAVALFDERGQYGVPELRSAHRSMFTAWDFIDVNAVRASGALEDAYSLIEQAGSLPAVVDALRASMSDIRDLRILKIEDEFILHLFVDEGPPIPAYLAGDGLKRLLAIAASVSRASGGVVLLEEPECFQHPRYLRELVFLLASAVNSNTQVIMTTHSSDLIDLLLHHEPALEQLVFQRLRLVDGTLRATALCDDAARMARDELLEDLRA